MEYNVRETMLRREARMAFGKTELPIDGRAALKVYRKLEALIEATKKRELQRLPTLFPRRDFSSLGFDGTTESILRLVAKVQGIMGIIQDEVAIVLPDSEAPFGETAVRRSVEGSSSSHHAAAWYCPRGLHVDRADNPLEGPAIVVNLGTFQIKAAESLLATLAHEFSHHVISTLPGIDPGDEEMADLLPLLYGFGIFTVNAALEYQTDGWLEGGMAWHSWSVNRLGYIPQPVAAFAFALVCEWKSEKSRQLRSELSPNPQSVFDKSRRFLDSYEFPQWSDPISGLHKRLELEASLDQEWEDTLPAPTIVRTDITWAGTFFGNPAIVRERDLEYIDASFLDFDVRSDSLIWREGTCFGVAYRIVSQSEGEAFVITESITVDTPGSEVRHVDYTRAIRSDNVERLAGIMGLCPVESPCRAVFRISHEGRVIAERAFSLLTKPVRTSLTRKVLDRLF
jgi:hypothetical protein